MPASIGVNLRVTGHCRQGGRKYMEDFFSVAYQQTEDERDLEYAFFGIYDGHGGAEAAAYAKEHLMETIVRQKNFWSDHDDDVLRAIKDGYIATHYAMWKEQEKWPKTASGLPSTAGTTASVAFIRRGKIYIGHVGDSGIILGYQEPNCPEWKARPLTKDHKPESAPEMSRIEQCGGKVLWKSGVPRVVWNRPRIGHQGPVRRSTPIDEIPFLAVARSLGDLWSYNSQLNEFVVSPDPDCTIIPIDSNTFRCLIFGTDGLFNMLSPQMAVHIVQQAEKHNESAALSNDPNKIWINPSKCLVEKALERWTSTKMRADNTSVITLLLDPPGPPRAQVLKNRKRSAYPDSGLKIVTRYEDNERKENLEKAAAEKMVEQNEPIAGPSKAKPTTKNVLHHEYTNNSMPWDAFQSRHKHGRGIYESNSINGGKILRSNDAPSGGSEEPCTSQDVSTNYRDEDFQLKTRKSVSYDTRTVHSSIDSENSCFRNECSSTTMQTNDEGVQINEVSSSSNDVLGGAEEGGVESDPNETGSKTERRLRGSASGRGQLASRLPDNRKDNSKELLKAPIDMEGVKNFGHRRTRSRATLDITSGSEELPPKRLRVGRESAASSPKMSLRARNSIVPDKRKVKTKGLILRHNLVRKAKTTIVPNKNLKVALKKHIDSTQMTKQKATIARKIFIRNLKVVRQTGNIMADNGAPPIASEKIAIPRKLPGRPKTVQKRLQAIVTPKVVLNSCITKNHSASKENCPVVQKPTTKIAVEGKRKSLRSLNTIDPPKKEIRPAKIMQKAPEARKSSRGMTRHVQKVEEVNMAKGKRGRAKSAGDKAEEVKKRPLVQKNSRVVASRSASSGKLLTDFRSRGSKGQRCLKTLKKRVGRKK